MTATLLFACLTPALQTSAQGYYFYNDKYMEPALVWELDLGLGIMNCITDVYGSGGSGSGPLKSVSLSRSQVAGSLGISAVYKDFIGFRSEYTFGNVTAFDSDHSSDPAKRIRNLDFASYIREISVGVEFYPIPLFRNPLKQLPTFSPYVMAGFGWFGFEPTTQLNGKTVRLQPLRLEGQGFAEYAGRQPYQLNALSLQAGVGLKYEISSMFNCRLEVVRRSTNTDFLDDLGHATWANPELFPKYLNPGAASVAQQLYDRSNPGFSSNEPKPRTLSKYKDVFWTAMLKFGLVINRRRR